MTVFQNKFHTQTSPWAFSEDGKRFVVLFIGFALMLASKSALAEAGDELGDGLCQLVNLLTGKYLFSLTVLAIIGSVSALIFGAEMTEGLKKIVGIIAIVSIGLMAVTLVGYMFSQFRGMSC